MFTNLCHPCINFVKSIKIFIVLSLLLFVFSANFPFVTNATTNYDNSSSSSSQISTISNTSSESSVGMVVKKNSIANLNSDVSYYYILGLIFFTFASIVMAGLYIYLNNLYFKNLLNKFFDWVSNLLK